MESRDLVFWRTLYLDVEGQVRTPGEALIFHRSIATWHTHFLCFPNPDPKKAPVFPFDEIHSKYITHVVDYTSGKTAGVTKGGYFGLLVGHARVGDVVAYLQNLSLMMLLRPMEEAGRYTYHGPCYVHGLGNGEKYPVEDGELEDIILG
jgi:hypothetical protein